MLDETFGLRSDARAVTFLRRAMTIAGIDYAAVNDAALSRAAKERMEETVLLVDAEDAREWIELLDDCDRSLAQSERAAEARSNPARNEAADWGNDMPFCLCSVCISCIACGRRSLSAARPRLPIDRLRQALKAAGTVSEAAL